MVRAAVLGLGLPHATSSHQAVTASIGVASTKPNAIQRPIDLIDLIDLIEAADAALYAAKHRGRNTVVEHGFMQMVNEAITSRSRVRHGPRCKVYRGPAELSIRLGVVIEVL
jgi:predicted signal transduction protein with EAL and GGDEF domain